MGCPKCQLGYVTSEYAFDSSGRQFGKETYCVNCGWRPTREGPTVMPEEGSRLRSGGAQRLRVVAIEVPVWYASTGGFTHQPEEGTDPNPMRVVVMVQPYAGHYNLSDVDYRGLRGPHLSLAVLRGLLTICESKQMRLSRYSLAGRFHTTDCKQWLALIQK